MANKPREYTVEEARESFLNYMANISHYWATLPDKTPLERCNGLAFSMLNIFDGTTMAMPGMDIVLRPHPDDKAYSISQGENWYRDGQPINADQPFLHEQWFKHARES